MPICRRCFMDGFASNIFKSKFSKVILSTSKMKPKAIYLPNFDVEFITTY